jgi:hypothetical protein
MVAVMGDVFALEYNFRVPLYFEGRAVRTRGWLYVTMDPSCCWSVRYFLFYSFSYWCVFFLPSPWCGVVGCWWSFCVLWC